METLLTGFLLSVSLCMDIGIVNIALIDASLKHGRRAGFWLGLGSCFGDLAYALLALAGMNYLLQFTAVRWVTWLGGGLVLLYLAGKMLWEAWQARSQPEQHSEIPPGAKRLFGRGLTLAMASPTSILWFAAVGGTLIVQATDGSPASTARFLAGFFTGGVAWSTGLAVLAHQGGKTMGPRFRQGCQLLSALLYLYFTILVLSNGYRSLWLAQSGLA